MTVPPYQLSVDGFAPDHFRVHSFTGKETLSEAYSFDIVVTAEAGEDVERVALGKRAVLTFHVGEGPRAFYGVVAAVRLAEVHQIDHKIKYEIRLVPRLWLLKRKRRTRIFQKMRVPDIVTSILGEAGIAVRWQLVRAYPEREYCTQYEETDYRFVQRLLAEAGVYFYFFGGGPVDDAALAADATIGAAASVGSTLVGEVAGSAIGSLVGSAAQMAETLIPGDTVVCADDASCYPPVAGDDPAALAASTAAALAPAVGDALGVGGGLAGAVVGTASAVAGTVIAGLTEGGREAPVLPFLRNEEAKVSTYDKVTRFSLRNAVRSSAATFRDYDPARPMVRLQSTAVSTQPFPPSPLEAAAQAAAMAENAASAAATAMPAAAASVVGEVASFVDTAGKVAGEIGAALGQKVPFEVYDHHSPFLFPKWGFANDEAPRMLRQKRRRASIAVGESGCSDFSPGHRFALQDHPAPQLDGTYALISVEHRGETHPGGGGGPWRVYWNEFECAPAEMTYPPARPKRKSVQVALTATVVGPPGEEIYVDEKGQIKVQFHWDREGKYDERSSCWIRVMQPWAGAAWGHQFIPRVGMEVVVVFEGGDPDKPMVLGSLYNGTHPPPFLLPGDKTRSGIRTQTSPGGGGFNELSFEDARGVEEIRLHAQRDLNEVVRHDHNTSVKVNRTVSVGGDREASVAGNRRERTTKTRIDEVGEDHREIIGKSRHLTIGGADYESIKGTRMTSIEERYGLQVKNGYTVMVGDAEAPRSAEVFAWGDHALGAGRKIRLTAKDGISLQCGDSSLEITKDGITLKGGAISLAGAKSVSMEGKGPTLTLGDEAELMAKAVRIVSSKSSLVLDDDAHLDGTRVKLNCKGVDPHGGSPDGDPPKTKHLSLKLTDPDFQPYASKQYMLSAGGASFEGSTDGSGKLEVDVPEAADVAQIILFLEGRPEGETQRYQVTLGDFPDASSVQGAQLRLKNLGYFWGEPGDQMDAQTERALREFQADHDLEVTGELGGPTAAKLLEVHGY